MCVPYKKNSNCLSSNQDSELVLTEQSQRDTFRVSIENMFLKGIPGRAMGFPALQENSDLSRLKDYVGWKTFLLITVVSFRGRTQCCEQRNDKGSYPPFRDLLDWNQGTTYNVVAIV